jgi:uncharacterized protein (DUF58 family)
LNISAPAGSDAPLFDEALLAQVRRLSLTPAGIRSSGLAGEHRSLRRGSSPEFADFKAYSIGDDFRRIDWNIYSRLGALFVRLSEVTTDISVQILLDASESMEWTGGPDRRSKFVVGQQLAGVLAYLALQRFDRVTITPFSDRFRAEFGPAQGRSNIHPMLAFISGLDASGETELPRLLGSWLQTRRSGGFLLLISDLLSGEPEELGVALRACRARGWEVAILHLLDPAERDPALLAASIEDRAAIELIDVESRDRLRLAMTDEVVDRSRDAARAWRDELDAICARERVLLIPIETERPLAELLGTLSEAGVIG